MKPLPPGDSASCPDEDAYQPEALKVQVGGNHYKNFDALQPAGFIDGGIFSEEEWGVRCPEALYRRPF